MKRRQNAVHVQVVKTIKKGKPYVNYYLRKSYREKGKVRKVTLGNLSSLPKDIIELIRRALKGEVFITPSEHFEIVRSVPHGATAAVYGMVKALGLEGIISSRKNRLRDLAIAMVVARVINPLSKLALARGFHEETQWISLGEELGLMNVSVKELYEAMDWLLERQGRIETKLGKRHIKGGDLLLYDVTSAVLDSKTCELAKFGYTRGGRRGKKQVVYGLLCNIEGCPVGVEVFAGNTADTKTFGVQVKKVRERWGVERVVWVGDRGMITEANIREELKGNEGIYWITALRSSGIRKLIEQGAVQMSLFDKQDLAEITHPDYPGERLVVCRNPLLALKRKLERKELIEATEKKLDKIVEATLRNRRRLKGKEAIGMKVGEVIGKYKVGKYFILTIEEGRFEYKRNIERISQDETLDGLYIIRTNVPESVMRSDEAVGAYKNLAWVEEAFRCMKHLDLKVEPVRHRLPGRVRAHIFLCMLGYYIEWHIKKALRSLLFSDHDREAAKELRSSVVAPAKRSLRACKKVQARRTEDGFPVHSFETLLQDLNTLCKHRIAIKGKTKQVFDQYTVPSPLHRRVFELLKVSYP